MAHFLFDQSLYKAFYCTYTSKKKTKNKSDKKSLIIFTTSKLNEVKGRKKFADQGKLGPSKEDVRYSKDRPKQSHIKFRPGD